MPILVSPRPTTDVMQQSKDLGSPGIKSRYPRRDFPRCSSDIPGMLLPRSGISASRLAQQDVRLSEIWYRHLQACLSVEGLLLRQSSPPSEVSGRATMARCRRYSDKLLGKSSEACIGTVEKPTFIGFCRLGIHFQRQHACVARGKCLCN